MKKKGLVHLLITILITSLKPKYQLMNKLWSVYERNDRLYNESKNEDKGNTLKNL